MPTHHRRLAVALPLALALAACPARRGTPSPADAGVDPARLNEQGQAHLRGGPESFSLEKAARLFEQSCEAGHAPACSALGLQVQDGRGVARDVARAAALYQRSCDAGAGIGCFNLALMLSSGNGVDIDMRRADQLFARAGELYRASCDAGDLQWCTNLGVLLESFSDPPDPAAAAAVYRKACDVKPGDWCVNLALCELDGRGVPVDVAGAVARLERTCAAGVPLACGVLGQVFVQDDSGIPRDLARALPLLDGACKDGTARACTVLGAVIGLGDVGPEGDRRAGDLHARACDLGESSACYGLGLGAGEAGRPAEAAAWLEKACNIGEGSACELLASMLATGAGVPADAARATALRVDACRVGSNRACVALLEGGHPLPLPPDLRDAFLAEACKQGVAAACAAATR